MWARTLLDELEELGYALSYPTLTRHIRERELRPVCEECRSSTERPNAIIEHPPGAETQWDWLDLPDPPQSWEWGRRRICWSGRWRIRASGAAGCRRARISRTWSRPGPGVPSPWRGDRYVAVRPDGHGLRPGSGRVTASFAAVAKHYGVSVAICPPRRGNRKGVVEKANHTAAQRWWRTLPDDVTRRAGPSRCRPVRGAARRHPDARHRRRQVHRRRRRASRTAGPGSRAPFPVIWPSSAPRRARRWWPTAATATRCRPSWPRPGHGRRTGSAASSSTSPPPAGSSSPGTGARRRAGATVRDSGHVIALDARGHGRRHHRRGRTGARNASHPDPPPSRRRRTRATHHRTRAGPSSNHPPTTNRFHRHRPVRLRAGRPAKDHPEMTNTATSR